MRHFCGKRDSVFGGQPRHAAEAVVGVVGGDGTLRRLGQPVVLVIGIGAACCPDVGGGFWPVPAPHVRYWLGRGLTLLPVFLSHGTGFLLHCLLPLNL